MHIGVPTEVKNNENRVALTPEGVSELVRHNHTILIQAGAGAGSGISDDEYRAQGATIVTTADEAWSCELVVKVKEPVASEYRYLRPDLTLFAYLHLAAAPPLATQLVNNHVTAIAYETVQQTDGSLPLLAPMSEIAGRLAVQVGAYHLMRPVGGSGVLMGGIAGTPRAHVVVLGGGVAGTHAAQVASGMGADVTVVDVSLPRLRTFENRFHGRIHTALSSPMRISSLLDNADLVIGAVLVAGGTTPSLVTSAMVETMRPGSVLVDVAIDQGGCFEPSRPTTHDDPTYTVHNSIFYCVANMPGAVPRTSTRALTNATLPYISQLAAHGWRTAAHLNPALASGINTTGGTITHPHVAKALGTQHSGLPIVSG